MNLATILSHRLVPVAVIDRVADAVPLAEALLAGGLPVLEVTLRTEAALAAIEAIRQALPEMQVGAGTLLDPQMVSALVDLGVSFAVSPGLNTTVLAACRKYGLDLLPGVITPTEIEQARQLGVEVLKFFPAEPAGGARFLSALAGPYAHTGIRFVPTGGIDAQKLPDYLKISTVAAVGGSWFVDRKLLSCGDFARVTELTKEALEICRK